ncbi:MAG: insulinase family protein [Deltaproteobacteria bacterium]|nr:insulinase family protein [Deltaproteobacteria bacterium]TLN04676.1 MAG: insulinase family protein [bacterium]
MKVLQGIFLLIFCAVISVSTVFAAGLEDMVREHTLKNGMKVLLVERHTSPTVAAWIRFKVGSVDERSDERGIAHLLEHMLFKGTKTLGTTDYVKEKPLLDALEKTAQSLMAEKLKRESADPKKLAELSGKLAAQEAAAGKYVVKNEVSRIYDKNGGNNYNAFTGKDSTAYMISLPANKLELWAVLESDRLRNAVLREFYTERNVVMEERRRSYDSDPQGKLWESFLAAAYQAHPYGQPIIGWMSDLENLSRTKAESFLHRYYAPVNAVVAIVGDIDPDKTITMVEKYFGSLPPGVPVPPVATVEPRQLGERRIEIREDAEPQFMIGYHKPTIPDPDDYTFDVITMLLADGKNSRLYKKLVVEKQLASDVSAFYGPGSRYANLFVISAVPRSPHTMREVEEAIYAELEILKKEPVSQRELQQVLNKLEADEIQSLSSNGGLAYRLTEYESVAGTWRYLTEHRAKVAKVTPAEVMNAAKKYLVPDNRTVAFITKREATR